jgi:MFS family permease
MTTTDRHQPAILTCGLAILSLAVAMGIGRFAFTPMLPFMVRDHLIAADSGSWLAASNYLGYLVGALAVSAARLPPAAAMRGSLAATALLTAAMGLAAAMPEWLTLRFAAGVASAVTLVATSAWALARLSAIGRADLAGWVYSGVGFGIALAGLFALVEAGPGVGSSRLWLELGALAAVVALPPMLLVRPCAPVAAAMPTSQPVTGVARDGNARLVIAYGLFGFGYILPATFLPALARTLVDDPRVFGLAWPLFGLAGAVSTIAAARLFARFGRLTVWAASHLVMAIGVVLPTLWLSAASIAIAALFVGGTFMVITMAGLQEIRERAPAATTENLGRMTAAFAVGQLAAPIVTGSLGRVPGLAAHATDIGLVAAGLALVVGAALLFQDAARHRRA